LFFAGEIGVPRPVFGLCMALILGYYPRYLSLKARVLGSEARNFLLDCVVFCFPAFIALHAAFDVCLVEATNLFLCTFLVILGMARVGCLFGGCCYGRRCSWGLRYPSIVFENRPTKRAFRPGPDPGGPVLPIQAVEAMIAAALLVYGWTHADSHEQLRVANLLIVNLYLLARFGLEFVRADRPRGLRLGLSETQWLILAVGLVEFLYLLASPS
jgi:prolipoprotein diacylglyceryltransferase